MIILGLDPSLCSFGWGVLAVDNNKKLKYIASGTIVTKSDTQMHLRLSEISNEIKNIIKTYNPDVVAAEESFVNKNALSSIKLAYARGAMMSVIGEYKLEFHEYKPNEIKKTLSGVGHADKKQMQYMLKFVIRNAPDIKSFDENDALAVAYTCFVRRSLIIDRDGCVKKN